MTKLGLWIRADFLDRIQCFDDPNFKFQDPFPSSRANLCSQHALLTNQLINWAG